MSQRLRYVQQAVIDELKGDTTVTSVLASSDEIREDEWPGTDWSYPCLRVATNLLAPASQGNCHLTTWLATFSVFVFTETALSSGIYDASSYNCSETMRRVVESLNGKKLTFSNGFVQQTRVNITGQNAPVPEPPPGGWRGEVLCEMRLKEV